MENFKQLAVIILAAGTSSRLGEPKQLLKYKGESLIKIAVKKAMKLTPNVTVVLGHQATTIIKEIIDLQIAITVNPRFKEGIGRSIAFGINETKKYENTLIMLCDQPFIPVEHFKKLIDKHDKLLVASQYGTYPTVPVIFSKKYYPELLKLEGDKGARELLRREDTPIVKLDKKYAVDIDTKEDAQKYLKEIE